MTTTHDRVRTLCDAIVEKGVDAHTLHPELSELVAILRDASGYTPPTQSIESGESTSASGLAVSPPMAAMCADDLVRSVVFMRAVHDAVKDRASEHPGQAISVLDAGCGPYTLLIIPALVLIDECVCTLVDIHESCVRDASKTLETLGLAHKLETSIVKDITALTRGEIGTPDVVVSETMLSALEREPQVGVMRALHAIAPDATMIPERIRVDLTLIDASVMFHPERDRTNATREIANVFTLSRETIGSWDPDEQTQLPAATIVLPDPIEDRFDIMFTTRVHAYGEHNLNDMESGLTVPRVTELGLRHAGHKVNFAYRLGQSPRIVYRVTEPDPS